MDDISGAVLARLRLMGRAEYVRALRPHLPAEAFRAQPRKLLVITVHSAIFLAGVLAITQIQAWQWRLPLALIAGHSLACLAFLGHDLSHGSVVRSRRLVYALELWVWGLRLMPPTVWRRVHNQVHHAHSNTPLDCDRRALAPEASLWVRAIGKSITPYGNPVRWNPLLVVAFVGYTAGQVVTAFLPGRRWDEPGPYRVPYRWRQRAWIAMELLVIAAMQAGLLALARFDLATYLWCAAAPLVVSSAITMAYIFTNHHSNVITESEDTLLGSTSVVVPRWIDGLHSHFSYHTEHHLFPGMNSDHYPRVSRLLQEKFPDRYQRVSFGDVWRRLWRLPFVATVAPRGRG